MILCTTLRQQLQKVNKILESQQTTHISPSRLTYRVSVVRILEKIDRVVTAPHCICIYIWIISTFRGYHLLVLGQHIPCQQALTRRSVRHGLWWSTRCHRFLIGCPRFCWSFPQAKPDDHNSCRSCVLHRICHGTSEMSSYPGPQLNIKMIFPGIGISIMKIRWSSDHLIFIMGIPILVRWHLCI